MLEQARTYNEWLTVKELIGKFEINMNVNDKLQTMIVSSLINSATLYRIQEGGLVDPVHNFRLDEYLNEVTTALFKAPTGGRLSDAEQSLQAAAIALMLKNTGLAPTAKASTSLTGDAAALHTGAIGQPATPKDAFDEMTSSFPCSCGMSHGNEFARINFGLPTLTKEQIGALMTGRLRKVLSLYKSRRAAATGSTKDFYDYQILLIERTFAN